MPLKSMNITTKILTMLAPLVGGAIGAGITMGRADSHLEQTTHDVAELKSTTSEIQKQRTEDALLTREIQTEVRGIARAVDRLESRLGTK